MKCLNQEGVKYLWSRIIATFATSDELLSECGAVASGLSTQISNHTGNTANPHNVTKAQIGLGDFDYEEGTWNKSIALYSDSSTTVTITNIDTLYKKIGNFVYIWAYLYTPTAVPCYAIGGLPFVSPVNRMSQKRSIMLWKGDKAKNVGTNAYVGTSATSSIKNNNYLASDTSYEWYIEGWYFI